MINRLKNTYPGHKIIEEDAVELFLLDHKGLHKGRFDLELTTINPSDEHVYFQNPNQVPIYFDAFPDNAFKNEDGSDCRQCEGIMFPQQCTEGDWILLIEMKYTNNIETAFKKEIGYPDIMIDQVVQSVEHLRAKGVIMQDKRVKALLAFPKLIEDFSAFFFTGTRNMEELLEKHNIQMRAKNSARIKSNINIKI